MSALPNPLGNRSTPSEGRPISAWERFLAARTSDAFCAAWLALICEKFPSARHAAVLIESNDGQTYVPIAVWPAASTDMARMGAAVQKALSEKRIALLPVAEQPELLHVAVPVMANERVAGAVVLEVEAAASAVQPLLRELHWGSAWLSNLLGKRELDSATEANSRSTSILETVAIALRHNHFQQALFELSNELRQRFDCSRVAIGLVDAANVKLAALSEAANFEKSSPMVQAYVDAMGESCDLAQIIEAYRPEDGTTPETYRAHALLLQRVGADTLITLPVSHHAQTIAVITLERGNNQRFTDVERKWLETFAALFSPVVVQRRDAERSSLKRLTDEGARFWRALLGPRYLLWKMGGLLGVLLLALLILLPVPYRISAKTVTEGSVQRVAAAPFEGFLADGFVRAGDIVTKGQILAKLDDHDLLVDRAKWASERDQYNNKLREAMANHDLSAIQVVTAQLNEAQAQLDLVQDKLSRVNIVSPYDGVIVTGDLSQQIGTPVEAGKKLFEIAPLHSYRIILQVDERDIGLIRTTQTGKLLMSGLTDDPMQFNIARIMPVATAKDGKNFYRVEAKLKHESRLLLPGMEGVGKIDVGKRKLGWVLLHSMFDWLRLTLWNWSP